MPISPDQKELFIKLCSGQMFGVNLLFFCNLHYCHSRTYILMLIASYSRCISITLIALYSLWIAWDSGMKNAYGYLDFCGYISLAYWLLELSLSCIFFVTRKKSKYPGSSADLICNQNIKLPSIF